MAYSPLVPNANNTVGSDLTAMQENFSLLESAQVVDSGSTADGDYIRYENGWQICTVEFDVDLSATCTYKILPQSFVNSNQFSGYGGKDNQDPSTVGDGDAIVSAFTRLTSDNMFQFRCNGAGTNTNFTIIGIVIGRWK